MSFQKRQSQKIIIQTLQKVIGSSEDVRAYFQKNCERKNYAVFMVELMRDGISYRNGKNKSKEKHYHVAYVKHNRFLSPMQKAEVTEKITQIIPIPDKNNKIFAKPKSKNTEPVNQFMHSDRQIVGKQENYQKYMKENIQQKQQMRQNVIDEGIQTQQQYKEEEYLHSKGSSKIPKSNFDNIKQNPQRKQSNNHNIHPKTQYFSPKSSQANNRLNIQSKYRFTSKQQMRAPVYSPRRKQNYDQVQSKIKGLIDNDKKNKKMNHLMSIHSKRIDQLEQRQDKLLLMQYQRQKQLGKPLKNNNLKNYDSSSSDSESLEHKYDSNRLSSLAYKIDAIDQRVQSVRDYHKTLYSAIQRLKNKTYKINSQPNYTITSSCSQESQNSAQR